MSHFNLLCNIKKCQKPLLKIAYVTSCLHIFCEEHSLMVIEKSNVLCPVCFNYLQCPNDITRLNLDLDEKQKMFLLVGLNPKLIMEIAHKGMAFWLHQVSQMNIGNQYLKQLVEDTKENLQIFHKRNQDLIEGLDVNKNHNNDLVQHHENQYQKVDEFQLDDFDLESNSYINDFIRNFDMKNFEKENTKTDNNSPHSSSSSSTDEFSKFLVDTEDEEDPFPEKYPPFHLFAENDKWKKILKPSFSVDSEDDEDPLPEKLPPFLP